MSKREIAIELHKPSGKNFITRRVNVNGKNDLWQADLVEMIPYSKKNKGYKYILCVIDCFTKFAWAVAFKSKTGEEVTNAMSKILIDRAPKLLQLDNGKEFYNTNFDTLMNKYNIHKYSTFSIMKSFSDNVRISTQNGVCTKGYLPNWSTEIFEIIKINKTLPVTYQLQNYMDKPISSCFYSGEIHKTDHPNEYLIEKIIPMNVFGGSQASDSKKILSDIQSSNKTMQNELNNQQKEIHTIKNNAEIKRITGIFDENSLTNHKSYISDLNTPLKIIEEYY
ncbi:Integrase catalytic domain-containing protein, partial [Aphis craccivora]